MELRKAIGVAIQRLRKERGMTMRHLEPHISIGHLSTIENGIREASNTMLETIASKLDMTTANLLKEVAHELEKDKE